MRTIGFLISVLLLWPLASCRDEAGKKDRAHSGFSLPALLPSPFALQKSVQKNTGDIDTGRLKQSSWYADAMRNIEESEYEIKSTDKTNEFASPNRQQNLRAFYSAAKFTLEPRMDDNWKLQLTMKGVYSGKKKIYSPVKDAIAVTDKNAIRFNHNNEFTVEYINSKEGVRQNFIVEKEPVSKPSTLNIKLSTNKGWLVNQVHPTEIHFAKTNGDKVEKKLTYNDLKVWDANSKELAASFSIINNDISITVNTDNAAYPITIDPLSTTPNSTLDDCNQANANFGLSVASAGDVNGDGYSDVIIGAYSYDDGSNTDEGRAFVYHGSATGLSATPNNTPDDADQASANFGYYVASAGDVNGDGYSDVIIGAYHYDDDFTDEGKAFVYYGSAAGLSASPDNTPDDANQGSANFGNSVASAGDVNGDGYSDVIIGASRYDDGFADEGKAFVYYGSATGLSASPDNTPDDADQATAYFGYCVASAGDVNGDGYSDVIIGAYFYNDGFTDEGKVFVYYGSATGLSASPDNAPDDADQASALFGNSVSCAGDVNGDGYSDVIIGAVLYDDGANTNEGRSFVYHGSSTGLSATPDATLDDADQAFAVFGATVSCAGDLNGDGYSDVIIGSSGYDDGANTNEGRAFVYYGSSAGLSATPDATPDDADQAFAQFGWVASAGDVNGDGFSDIIIGANGYDDGGNTDEGFAFVYHGSPDGLQITSSWQTESNQANAYYGVSVASAGDVNADGYSDVIVGAVFFDNGQTNEGAAFIYHGSATGISTSFAAMLESNQADSDFGRSVASAGDVNGDGYGDVIIGAWEYDNGQTDEGAAFIYHGSSTGISTAVAATVESNQGSAYLGFSVAGAGDVNGDGYGDVIAGVYQFDNGQFDEGAAFVYHGSSTGINTAVAATIESNQAFAQLGLSVAGAGDVNGDGYGDVIVGARYFDNGEADEGAAFVHHGSATGINTTAAVSMESNQAGAWFGYSVAGAGDVNGDGYGDVIVGSYYFDNGQADEGAAFVYHGSSTGISNVVVATVESNQVNAFFGISVAAAGDINGDGYSDIIVGSRYFDNGQTDEGAAFVYHGSSTGISTSFAAMVEQNQANADLGYSVACAGDVNGDGYSDVIVGADEYDNGQSNEGTAYVYYGNNSGLHNNLRLYNSDLITPIQQSNMTDPNLFGAGLYAKSFIGRQKGKLTWQTVKNGVAFPGSPITNNTAYTSQDPAFTDLGLTGAELKHTIAKQIPAKATYIRARVKYDLTTAITGQVYGPWRYPEGFLRGRRDVGSVALPVKFISFSAVKDGASARLKWITTEEEPGVRFEVQHSVDGTNFTALVSINGRNQGRNEYEWLHTNPAKGNNFYRIKAIENNKSVFTATRMLNFDKDLVLNIYPNPSAIGGSLTIENAGIMQNEQATVSLISLAGQPVFQKEWKATETGRLIITVPELPAGIYLLHVRTGSGEYSGKITLVNR